MEAAMKYEPLKRYLEGMFQHGEVRLDFAAIERILLFSLPRSAYEHQAWWSNTRAGHSHAAAWLDAGWKTAELDQGAQKVTFVKMRKDPVPFRSTSPDLAPAGLSESGASFQYSETKNITLLAEALGSRAMRMIDGHIATHGGDRASACATLLNQLANDRLAAMVNWFQNASPRMDVDVVDLIREDRDSDER
jgi:hypothetical protein